jgi:hypothetical protein
MAIGHVVIGFLREYVAQLPFLLMASDGKESFDLFVTASLREGKSDTAVNSLTSPSPFSTASHC